MNTDKSPDTMGAAPTLEEPLASTSVGGRKSIEAAAEEAPAVVLIDDDDSSYLSEDDDEYSDSEYDDSDDEDEEEDEAWLERLRILKDARQLKKVAAFFLHPEKPVVTESTVSARCFFERASAVERTSAEEEAEYIQVMEEAENLKKLAADFAHPERSVEAEDPTIFARCYFARVSAEEQLSCEEADERARLLEDAKMLKEAAYNYLHPEEHVKCTDATVFGRNYYAHASASEQESMEEAEERERILAEAQSLKKHAIDYLHPEVPVRTTDPTACGRNYFNRVSAPGAEDVEDAEERARILEEAALLKKSAVSYLHPEAPVQSTDGSVFGRNYFNRPSALGTEDVEEVEERARILEEAALLKKSVVDYLHPEAPVQSIDGTAFGRNYFNRPSAQETEDMDDVEERSHILEEAALLKKSAVNYLHPEAPVQSTNGTAFGRNYFNRPSAPETDDVMAAEERALILAEAELLKKSAMGYLHPEVPVCTTDIAACGRNYFNRPGALETEDAEAAEERARILEEVALLKKSAVDYLHPEKPIQSTDGTAFGRNFFNRSSAAETEDNDKANERARILEESKLLKKSAVDFLHPEASLQYTDGSALGRNYFNRPSAPETEDVEAAKERTRILEEAVFLKRNAVDFLHPEAPVSSTDPAACGRNYFCRASAPGVDQFINSMAEGQLEEKEKNTASTTVEKEQVFKSVEKDLAFPKVKYAAQKIPSRDNRTEKERSPSAVMLFNSGATEEAF